MPTPPNIALVGATGAVGQECLSILEQRRFPHAAIRLLASARSAGKTLTYRGQSLPIEELGPNSFKNTHLAFFAAGSNTAKAFAPIANHAGATVIDKSSAHRADPTCPLVIPEINPEALFSPPPAPSSPSSSSSSLRASVPGGACLRASLPILSVPNCSTIILLVPLNPLRQAFGISRILVSTYQAASGAGAAAMDELHSQTQDVLAGRPATQRIFKEPCAFNVFSHDSAMNADSGQNGEEEKMAAEARRIWNDPDLLIHATCVRVPVLRGHSESITISLKTPATYRQIRETLAAAPGLTLIDDRAGNRFPTPLKATGGDTILVGRIRPDPTQDEPQGQQPRSALVSRPDAPRRGWSLFVSGDQLRKGAALTAVQIAEKLLP